MHLLCGAHPKYTPGQLVRLFKSITGRELFKRHGWLKKELWGRRVLDGWILCGDGWRARRLEGCGEIRQNARQRAERSAVEIVVVFSYPVLLAQGL